MIDLRLEFSAAVIRADKYIDQLMVHQAIGQDDGFTQWFRLSLEAVENRISRYRKALEKSDPQFIAEFDAEQAFYDLPLH